MLPVAGAELIELLRAHELINEKQARELTELAAPGKAPDHLVDELVERGWLTDLQREYLQKDQLQKLDLGGYRLVSRIGAGGMGEVFLARQKKLNRDVAVKLIRADFAAGHSDALHRFRREALAVARLAHPNIVHIYDVDELNGTHFLIMEYVRGSDLSQLVAERGPLPVMVACDFIRQAALGLQHAFEAGLVHRDIKPSNLLVVLPESPSPLSFGLVKILDLGLALIDDDAADVLMTPEKMVLTKQRGILGTPDYMSPEQARDSHRTDTRSDLYSLGCTFYFLLTGQVPYPAGTSIEKLLSHQRDRCRPITMLRPDVPASVQAVVGQLMQKDPRDRYQTPAELVAALVELERKLTRPPVWPTPVSPAAPSLVPLPLAAARSLLQALPPPNLSRTDVSRIVPVAPSLLPPPSSADFTPLASALKSTTSMARPRKTSTSTNGCRVVKAATVPDLAVTRSTGSNNLSRSTVLQGHTAPVLTMAFTANGRFLASGGLDHAVRLWRLDHDHTRQETAFLDGRLGEVRAMAFMPSDDELLIAASGAGGRIWRWCWRSDRAHEVQALRRSPGTATLAVSPDGRLIAAAERNTIHLWQFKDGEPQPIDPLLAPTADVTVLRFGVDGQSVIAGDSSGQILAWQLRKRRFRSAPPMAAHQGTVTCLSLSPDGRYLASAGIDNTVRIWANDGSGTITHSITTGLRGVVRRLHFGPDSRSLITISDCSQVAVWSVNAGASMTDWRLNQAVSTGCAITHDGRMVALGATDGSINLYELVDTPASPSLASLAETPRS